MIMNLSKNDAFTLIELSIVLVIIGLIVGGVLVGKDLIQSAQIRSQTSQVEKYQLAVNTFKLKYGCLPGDCRNAAQFGFVARGSAPGQGDGDERLMGKVSSTNTTTFGACLTGGETPVFWRDLSAAGLIAESFTTATVANPPSAYTNTDMPTFFPRATINERSSVYAASLNDQKNYFGVTEITSVDINCSAIAQDTMPVAMVNAIDTKIDDGYPLSGRVMAINPGGLQGAWSKGLGGWVPPVDASGAIGTWADSATNCFYKAAGMTRFGYSMQINQGAGTNCSVAIRMQ